MTCRRCKRLKRRNVKLAHRLSHMITMAQRLAATAQDRMDRGNLPRTNWAYLKAVRNTARAIARQALAEKPG